MRWESGLYLVLCLVFAPCLAHGQSEIKSDPYVELAKILAAGDEVIVETVRSARESPKEYLATDLGKATAERLRFVEDKPSSSDLPWLALLDILLERGLAVEIDWEDGSVDIHWALEQAKPLRMLPSSLESRVKGVRGTTSETTATIRKIAHILREGGLVVGWYRLESDSYPLIFLDRERFRVASRLAAETGHSISDAALTID